MQKFNIFIKSICIYMILFIFCLGCSEKNNPNKRLKKQRINTVGKTTKPHKYSILALRKKRFPENKIKIVRKIKEYSTFTSFVISYKSENLRLYSLMNIPKKGKKKYPVIIVNHGYIPPHRYSTEKSYYHICAYFAYFG